MQTRIAVLGAGAWGTAISCVLAARLEVSLWARDAAQAKLIGASRRNERSLPLRALDLGRSRHRLTRPHDPATF